MMVVVSNEETRKGPWTEEEDSQLMSFVGLFGERRWDFIAQVSGLNRSGKSCRLRWVNYLHPGLKRCRISPEEERLILDLHARWGNRWSRIARKLPGRTDNEIKNYWRTHTRKKAQDRRSNRNSLSSSSSSTSSVCDPPLPSSSTQEAYIDKEAAAAAAYDQQAISTTGNSSVTAAALVTVRKDYVNPAVKGYCYYYPMEKIWDEIASTEIMSGLSQDKDADACSNNIGRFAAHIPSPDMWGDYYCSCDDDSVLWNAEYYI